LIVCPRSPQWRSFIFVHRSCIHLSSNVHRSCVHLSSYTAPQLRSFCPLTLQFRSFILVHALTFICLRTPQLRTFVLVHRSCIHLSSYTAVAFIYPRTPQLRSFVLVHHSCVQFYVHAVNILDAVYYLNDFFILTTFVHFSSIPHIPILPT